MEICTHTYMYIMILYHVCNACMHACAHIYTAIHVQECMYVCMHVCMYICMYIYIYTHTRTYICIDTHHTHTHMQKDLESLTSCPP